MRMMSITRRRLSLISAFEALLLLALLLSRSEARKSTSHVYLHIPKTEMGSSKDGYPHQLARFGMHPREGSMTHRVYYYPADAGNFCHEPLDFTKAYPRTPRSKNENNATSKALAWKPPFILMVDRHSGAQNCDFVRMARRGEVVAGASAVVILDDLCVCKHADCNGTAIVCAPHEPLLVSDGSASDIQIPTVLLYKAAADELRSLIKDKNEPLLLELTFGRDNDLMDKMPSEDGAVVDTCANPIADYALWTTPIDPVSVQLFAIFPKLISKLQSELHEDQVPIVRFSGSHSYLIYGNDAKKGADEGNKPMDETDGYWHCPTNADCAKSHLCTNNGRYCSTPTRASTLHGIKTIQVVQESLRRECIWKTYHRDSADAGTDEERRQRAIGTHWWNYVSAFTKTCYTVEQAKGLDVPSPDDNSTTPSRFADDSCVQEAYKAAHIDGALIEDCIANSGEIYVNSEDNPGNATDTGNSVLDAAAGHQARHGVYYHPMALVDEVPLAVHTRDAVVSAHTLFFALCAAIESHEAPPLSCHTCKWCHDVVGCIEHGSCEAAWKAKRADEKQHNPVPTPPSTNSRSGRPHHFFKVLFSFAVIGLFSYGGWYYYQNRYGGGGVASGVFGRGAENREGGNSFLGNYVPLQSGEGSGPSIMASMLTGGNGGGMTDDGTAQLLSG